MRQRKNATSKDGPVIQLINVSVCYRKLKQPTKSLKEFTLSWLRGQNSYSPFQALKSCSLCVKQGETVGIIGANGAGKSTLLKVIARVVFPTSGRVIVRGNVAPILALGAGFNPEMSGRENIYLNGAMLGFSRAKMEEKIKSLLDFAGLGSFIDSPLRTYSSGMVARLAFSIATDVNPEILLIDEILSVGDKDFRNKCLDRMSHFRSNGKTILLVSHNLDTVASLCQRAIWMEHGSIRNDGPALEIIQQYKREKPHSTIIDGQNHSD